MPAVTRRAQADSPIQVAERHLGLHNHSSNCIIIRREGQGRSRSLAPGRRAKGRWVDGCAGGGGGRQRVRRRGGGPGGPPGPPPWSRAPGRRAKGGWVDGCAGGGGGRQRLRRG